MDIHELEMELARLKPVKMPKLRLNRPEKRPNGWVSYRQILTLSLGILIGGFAVHFMQKPVVVEVVKYVEPQPQPVEVKPEPPQRRPQPQPQQFSQPFSDVDALLAEYNRRALQFAHISIPTLPYYSVPTDFSSNPDSMLQLRNRIFN